MRLELFDCLTFRALNSETHTLCRWLQNSSHLCACNQLRIVTVYLNTATLKFRPNLCFVRNQLKKKIMLRLKFFRFSRCKLVRWWLYFGFLRSVVDVSSTFRRAEFELHMKSVTWEDVCLFLWLNVKPRSLLVLDECCRNVLPNSKILQKYFH